MMSSGKSLWRSWWLYCRQLVRECRGKDCKFRGLGTSALLDSEGISLFEGVT